jgi:hypothetical protein
MRPKVLITQKIFDEAVALVKKHFEVDYNPSDTPLSPPLLIKRLQDPCSADASDDPLYVHSRI